MKTSLERFQVWLFCAVALGIGSSLSLAAAASDSAAAALEKTSQAIPWSQLGAKAGAGYQGNGLAGVRTADGAQLRCVFQRLEGEATREGLWLTSTVIPTGGTVNDSSRDVMVSWPSTDTADFALEQAGTLAAPASWNTTTASITDDGTTKSMSLPATNGPQFFRLKR